MNKKDTPELLEYRRLRELWYRANLIARIEIIVAGLIMLLLNNTPFMWLGYALALACVIELPFYLAFSVRYFRAKKRAGLKLGPRTEVSR